MSGRTRSLGVARAALVAIAGALVGACYDVPRPACGFTCGPASACPSGYACAADRICHRSDAPADLACAPPDAAGPDAAAIDAPGNTGP